MQLAGVFWCRFRDRSCGRGLVRGISSAALLLLIAAPAWGQTTFSGTVYDPGGGTLASVTVSLARNGIFESSDVSDATGAYSLTSTTAAGDRVLVHLDTDGGAAGCALTIHDGVTAIGAFDVHQNQVRAQHDNLGTTITFTDLSTAHSGDTDINYSVATGILTLGPSTALVVADSLTLQAASTETLRLEGGRSVRMGNLGTLQVDLGAVIETSATTITDRATITCRSGSGTYAFTAAGSVDMTYYNVYHTDVNGMQLLAGATVTSLNHGTFDLGASGTGDVYGSRSCLLNFSSWDDGSTLSIDGCVFRNTAEAAYAANVKSNTAWTSGGIKLYGYSGERSGPDYEDEDTADNWITWSPDAKSVQVMFGAAAGYYATIQDALNGPDGTAATADDAALTELRVLDNRIHVVSATITLSANNIDVIITRGLLQWTGAAGGNIFDGTGATGETWRNCIIFGNTPTLASTEYLENCTIDGSANGGTTYTNTLATGTLTATTKTTCLESIDGVASTWFIAASAGDYHLDPDNAAAAINAGTDLSATFTKDFDGMTRPVGAGTWDIGADECQAAANARWAWIPTAERITNMYYNYSGGEGYVATRNGAVVELKVINLADGTEARTGSIDDGVGGGLATTVDDIFYLHMAKLTATEVRVFLVVDTADADSTGDSILALYDNGTTIVLNEEWDIANPRTYQNSKVATCMLVKETDGYYHIYMVDGGDLIKVLAWDGEGDIQTSPIPGRVEWDSNSLAALDAEDVAEPDLATDESEFSVLAEIALLSTTAAEACVVPLINETTGLDLVRSDLAGASYLTWSGAAETPVGHLGVTLLSNALYVAPRSDHYLHRLRISPWGEQWRSPALGGQTQQRPGILYRTQYLYVPAGARMHRLVAGTGALTADSTDWPVRTNAEISTGPVLDNGYCYFGTETGVAWCVGAIEGDTTNGNDGNADIRLQYRLPNGERIRQVFSDRGRGQLLYLTETNKIYAFPRQ